MTILLSGKARLFDGNERYKVAYGGRGGGKSEDIGGKLLIKGAENKLNILCCREIQKSISKSVHSLLKTKIYQDEALRRFYRVTDKHIRGLNGTEFTFEGLKHNPDGIRSYYGTDIAWVEEANNVSHNSWEILIPTIRKPGSQIWMSFNPRYPTDPTYERFITHADSSMRLIEYNWRHNPFLPDVLNEERKRLQRDDPAAYNYVWEGKFDKRFTGQVYAQLIADASKDGRIGKVKYTEGAPVLAIFDIGHSHYTSIWFAQHVGLEKRIIGFYQNSNKGLGHYADILMGMPYKVDQVWLPHDSRHERLGMEGSVKSQMINMGFDCFNIPNIGIEAGVQLGRELMQDVWIDKDETTEGIHCLNHYQYEYDENLKKFKDKPKDDWSADASDAWRYTAIVLNQEVNDDLSKTVDPPQRYYTPDSWMG